MRFREFVDAAKANVRERQRGFTHADDDWPITLLVDFPGEDPHPIDMPPWVSNSDMAKTALAAAIDVASRAMKPTKVAFISSTWQVARPMSAYPQGVPRTYGEALGMRPSQHPDRFETVILVVVDQEIAEGWTATIKRRRYGPPLLGEWTKVDDVSGAMIDPWRDALR